MSVKEKSPYRYIGTKRRAKEHPRFVSGRGRFVADIALPGMKHVALVASPHAAARIVSIDIKAALAAPGVLHVLTGEEFCARTDSLATGVDAVCPPTASAPSATSWPSKASTSPAGTSNHLPTSRRTARRSSASAGRRALARLLGWRRFLNQ